MSDRRATLEEILSGSDAPAYAVLDGAVFADLPALLASRGLSARPLLRDEPGGAVQREGPWLCPVGEEPRVRAALLSVLAEAPGRAGVIWMTGAGEDALYGHLRSLNHVLLPPGERVFFRQADPDVMNAVLRLLDAEQAARMLGPARMVAFESAEAGGACRVVRPDGLPPAPEGELAFRRDQIEDLNARQRDLSVAAYLREVAADETEGVPAATLLGFVRRSRASAEALGVAGEPGIKRWAYLLLMTDGRIEGVAEVRAYVRRGEEAPARQVEKLVGHTARALREGRTVPPLDGIGGDVSR
ncbi:DUF4123 domain-containing protein [Methylobacterium indicum]|uniref:DUF4123 domain-containing protein n=1 Tax=Methylobacterium indicum TaxID=1775910 RepID=UPI00243579C2|nr:DUF4123 domain-containing protein [Methylobacterium indicum]